MDTNAEIITQIDAQTGAIVITVPQELVALLGWRADSTILYVVDPAEHTILAKLAK